MDVSPYVNKIKSLQQYRPFLNSVIGKLERCADKGRGAQLNKLKQIRSIIDDDKSRKRFDTLLKCEKILERLYQKVGRKSEASGGKSSGKDVGIHIPDIRDSSDFDNPWSPISETYEGSASREPSPQPGSTLQRSPPLSAFVERICHSPSNSSFNPLQPRSPSPQYHRNDRLHDSNFEESRSVSFFSGENGFASPDYIDNEPRIIPLERPNQRYHRLSSYNENWRELPPDQQATSDVHRTGIPLSEFPDRSENSVPNALPLSSEDINRLISELGPSLGIAKNLCDNSSLFPSRSSITDVHSSRYSDRCSSISSSRLNRYERIRNESSSEFNRHRSVNAPCNSSTGERLSETESVYRRSYFHESGQLRREVRFQEYSRNSHDNDSPSVVQSGSRNVRDYKQFIDGDRSENKTQGYHAKHDVFKLHSNGVNIDSLGRHSQYATSSAYAIPTTDRILVERGPIASSSGVSVKEADLKKHDIPISYGVANTITNVECRKSQDLNSYFKCLLLKNLSRAVSRHDIVRFFNGFGMTETILQTDVSNQCTGIGYAQFVDHEEAKRALSFSVGKSVNGQYVQAYPCDSEVFSDAKQVYLSSNSSSLSNKYPPSAANHGDSFQNKLFMQDPRLSSRRKNVADTTHKGHDSIASHSKSYQPNPYNNAPKSMVTDPRVLAKLAYEKSQREKERRNASIEENQKLRKSDEIVKRKAVVKAKRPNVSSSTNVKKSPGTTTNSQLFRPASLASFKIPKIKRQSDELPEVSSCKLSEIDECNKTSVEKEVLPENNQEPEISSTVLSDDLPRRRKIHKRQILSSDSESETEAHNSVSNDSMVSHGDAVAVAQEKHKSKIAMSADNVKKDQSVTSGHTDMPDSVNVPNKESVSSVHTEHSIVKNEGNVSPCQSVDGSVTDTELCEIQVQSDEADDNDEDECIPIETNKPNSESVDSPKKILPVEADCHVSEVDESIKKKDKIKNKIKKYVKKKINGKAKSNKSAQRDNIPLDCVSLSQNIPESLESEVSNASKDAEKSHMVQISNKSDALNCTDPSSDNKTRSDTADKLSRNNCEKSTNFEAEEEEKMQECLQRKLIVKLTKSVNLENHYDSECWVRESHTDDSKYVSSKSAPPEQLTIENISDAGKGDYVKTQHPSKAWKGLVPPSRCHICRVRTSSMMKHYLAQHPNDVFPVKLSQAFLKIILEEELGPGKEVIPNDLSNDQLAQLQDDDLSWIPESVIFDNIVECRYCDYYAVCKPHLIEHVACHKRSGKSMPQKYFFACRFCDCKCATAQIMYDHLCWHTGELRYSCSLCGFKTPNILNLKDHHVSNHSEKGTGIVRIHDRDLQVENTWIYAYACKICRFVQLNEERVRFHMDSQHQSNQDAIVKFNVVKALTDDDSQYNKVLQSFFQRKDQLESECASHKFLDCDLVFTIPDDVTHKNMNDESNKVSQMKLILDTMRSVVSSNRSDALTDAVNKVVECSESLENDCDSPDKAITNSAQSPRKKSDSLPIDKVAKNQQGILDDGSSNTVDDVISDSMSTSSLDWDGSSEASFSDCYFSDAQSPSPGGESDDTGYIDDVVQRLSSRVTKQSRSVVPYTPADSLLDPDVSQVQHINSVPDVCRSLLQDFEQFEQNDSAQKPAAIRVRRFSGDTLSTFQESPPLKISNIVSLSGSSTDCMSSDVAVCGGISEVCSRPPTTDPAPLPTPVPAPAPSYLFDSADGQRPWRALLTLKDPSEVLRLMHHVHHRSVYKCAAVHCSFTANSGLLFRLHLNLPKHLACTLCGQRVTGGAGAGAVVPGVDRNCCVTRLVCVYCGYTGHDLPEHVYRRHSASRLQCGYCFYRTSNVLYIHDHQRRWHKHVPPYFLKSDLSNPPPGLSSTDTVASDEYPLSKLNHYICTQADCGMKVFKAVDLLYHFAKDHASATNFSCSLCPVVCNSPIELLHHYISHELVAYCCTYCEFSCHSERQMKVHLIDFHPDDPPKCRCRITKEVCERIEEQFPSASRETVDEGSSTVRDARQSEETAVAVKQEPVTEPSNLSTDADLARDVEEVDVPQLKIQRCQSLAADESRSLNNHQLDDDDGDDGLVHTDSRSSYGQGDDTVTATQTCGSQPAPLPSAPSSGIPLASAGVSDHSAELEDDPLSMADSPVSCADPLSETQSRPQTEDVTSGSGGGGVSGTVDPEAGVVQDVDSALPGSQGERMDEVCDLSGHQLYRCGNKDCTFSVANYKLFREHLPACEHRGTAYMCVHCSLQVPTLSSLLEHIQQHGRKRYHCSLCSQFRATTTVSVRKHMRSEHRVQARCYSQAVACSGREKHVVYSSRCSPLSASVIDEQGQQRSPVDDQESTSSTAAGGGDGEVRMFSPDQLHLLPARAVVSELLGCQLCPYRSHVTRNLSRHLQAHSRQQQPQPLDTDHEQGQERPDPSSVSAAVCDPVNPPPRISEHTAKPTAGSSEPPPPVPVDLVSDPALPREVPEELRYVCSIAKCHYITLNTTMLRYHIQAVHGQLTVYPCPHCGLSVNPDSLGSHLRHHAAELYRCSHCLYSHYQRRLVLRHVRVRHPGQPELAITVRKPGGLPIGEDQQPQQPSSPRWCCHLCRFNAAHRSLLHSHIAQQHAVHAQFVCAVCASGCASLCEVRRHYDETHGSSLLHRVCVTYSLQSVGEEEQQQQQQWLEERRLIRQQMCTPLWRRHEPTRIRHVRGIPLEQTRSPVKRRSAPGAGSAEKRRAVPDSGKNVEEKRKSVSEAGDGPDEKGKCVSEPVKNLNEKRKCVSQAEDGPEEKTRSVGGSGQKRKSVSGVGDGVEMKRRSVSAAGNGVQQKVPAAPVSDGSGAGSTRRKNVMRQCADKHAAATIPSDESTAVAVPSVVARDGRTSDGEQLLHCYEDRAVSFGGLGKVDLKSKQMVCPRCRKYSTKLPVNMRKHLYKEFAYNRFVCGHCGFAASIRSNVLRHHETAHRGSSLPPSVSVLNVDTQLENWVEAVIVEQNRQLSSNSVQPLDWDEKPAETKLSTPPRSRAGSASSSDSLPTPKPLSKAQRTDKNTSPGVGSFSCPKCPYTSNLRFKVSKHLVVHYRSLSCDHCRHFTYQRLKMMFHLANVHPDLPASYHTLQNVVDQRRKARHNLRRMPPSNKKQQQGPAAASVNTTASSCSTRAVSANRHQVARKSTARRSRSVAVKSTGGRQEQSADTPPLPHSCYGQRPPPPGQFGEVTTQLVMPDGTSMAINVPTLAQIFRLYPSVHLTDIKNCFSI